MVLSKYSNDGFESSHKLRSLIFNRKCKKNVNIGKQTILWNLRLLHVRKERSKKLKKYIEENKYSYVKNPDFNNDKIKELIENRKIGIYLKENINNSINKSIFHNSKLKKKNPRIQIIALIMFFIK